ncbi:MAG: choice-of-anchor D domain-containing protein [Myxococcota bacterium]
MFRFARPWLLLSLPLAFACSDKVDPIGQLKPNIMLDTLVLDFGDVQVGTERQLRVKVENTGTAILSFTASPGEPFDDAFTFAADKTDVPTTDAAFINVSFKPTSLGSKSGFIKVVPKSTDLAPLTVELKGRGATAELLVEPKNLTFGNVVVLTDKTLTIDVTNTTQIPADVAYIEGTNIRSCNDTNNPATFCFAPTTKLLTPESRFSLAAGEKATFNVGFKPTVVGTRERGDFSFQACSSCPVTTVHLDGQGIEAGFVCMPANLDFGTVNPQSCVTKTVTCQNVANEQVTVTDWRPDPAAGTSADFHVAAFTTAKVLAPNDTVSVDVQYCPADLGNDTGSMIVETDNTDVRRKYVNVTLAGNGGGPDIDVQPTTINFGQVSLIAPSRRNIQVLNVGFAPLNIIDVLPDIDGTGAFNVVNFTAGTIGVGEAMTVTVEFQPQAEGMVASHLVVKSTDSDEPEVRVSLAGEGVNLPPCSFDVVPSALSFGVVERGRMNSRAFEVRNTGVSDCLITSARLVAGSDPEFSLPDGDVSSLRIAPGSSATFRVVYAPMASHSNTGTVEFSISSPTSPFNTVSLTGTGADSVLLITPNDLDFGTIGIGCSARARTVTMYNTGATAAVIDSIALAAPGNPAFEVRSLPAPLPGASLTLPPGGSAEFDVGFHAAVGASYAAAVEISGRFNNQPVTYIVSLQGRGAADAIQTDHFEQLGRPKVDILWIIDDSGSMSEEQQALGSNIASFLQYASAQQIDYQMAVTTTDVDNPAESGHFLGVAGNLIVTPNTQPSPESVFAQNADRGTNGSGFEQGLQGAYLALSNPLIFTSNAGFLRQDAVLSIIAISDEEDQSPGTVDFFINFFLSIKGFRNTNLFTFSSIVGDHQTGCNSPSGNAQAGERYIETSNRTGGVFQSICTADWSRALEDLSTTAFGFKSRFFLSNQPVISSLSVVVDGVSIDARSMGGTVNWSYDFGTNSVNFTPFATPEPGASIEIHYTVECLH